jgi:chromosome segregation protein
MRLSKLQISGFKSFPDRAELGFDRGVTAIVGPNGCGKSNVVDAITWVLGEQSAKSLRGERMEDVIFNGSDARKPTATAEVRLGLADVAQAAPMAEETADSDDAEVADLEPALTRNVEIGRRLYRSGESEYLIDGEVCRLRDIHDLLMDSGLGVKAYAVIEQGKIGQILSSRPAERRTLIEEAAGVTKYKSRRRSAELKLEAARQNLTRIDDIIFEVEKQRGALKRQAARARRYKRLREELRRWEQVQFAHRHHALAAEIAAAENRLSDARGREASAAVHVAELEARLEGLRLALAEAEARATQAREAAHAAELEIGRRQQQVQFDRQQLEDLGQRSQALAAEVDDLAARRDPAQAAIETQREALARARELLEGAAAQVTECETDYTQALAAVQGAEQDADQARAALLASTTTLSALRQARDNAADARDRVAAQRTRLEVEARDLEHEIERARGSHDSATTSLSQAQATLDEAVRGRKAAEEQLADQRSRRAALGVELTSRQRELAAHEARLHSLEELDSRRETFGDAARYLLAEAPASIRQHGALADHLDVERSYERAVDALLGDLLQHVLVDTHDDVSQALAQLASANAGRAGFVVLSEAPATGPSDGVMPMDGARALNDVVHAKGPHAPAIAALVGDALIVEEFEHAKTLSATAGVAVATRSGDVFRGAALVEGGARQDARGILEMRGEIDRRREETQAQVAAVHALANDAFELDLQIGESEEQLASSVAQQHAQEKAIVGLEAQTSRHTDDLARLTRRLQVVDTERRRALDEEQNAERRREEAAASIGDHETQQHAAEAQLADVMAHVQGRRDAAEAKMRLFSDARTAQATLGERSAGLETEVRRLEEAAHDLEARITGRRQELDHADTRRAELTSAIADNERRLDQDVRDLDALKQRVRDADDAMSERRGEFGAREVDIRGARQTLEAHRAEVMQFELARATAAADLTHLASACLDAVNSSIEEVVVEVARMEQAGELAAPGRRLAAIGDAEEEEAEPAQESAADAGAGGSAPESVPSNAADGLATLTAEDVMTDLRRKIERLGPVNMMAIEQFDELETRHTVLTSQRTDLLDSIAQTGEAIQKIEKTTRERFEEAFAVINANFEQTFTTLFGGGRAGLVLIDQENETESGIDIIAQPPGKRLQNVQLLSGGEKALTAMGLMFAIFKYRPSPFCLLDEIDAPLDDANIGRFVEMLRGMQSHTQFILITHNRKTMEIANRLYGVTMEEPGVSKLISLQMN